jgi:hypothetical protein
LKHNFSWCASKKLFTVPTYIFMWNFSQCRQRSIHLFTDCANYLRLINVKLIPFQGDNGTSYFLGKSPPTKTHISFFLLFALLFVPFSGRDLFVSVYFLAILPKRLPPVLCKSGKFVNFDSTWYLVTKYNDKVWENSPICEQFFDLSYVIHTYLSEMDLCNSFVHCVSHKREKHTFLHTCFSCLPPTHGQEALSVRTQDSCFCPNGGKNIEI